MSVLEVVVPHLTSVAEAIPGEQQEFGVATAEGLGKDGVVTSAVLFLEVVVVDFGGVTSTDADVRAVVGGSEDGSSNDGDGGDGGNEVLEHF